MPRPSGPPPKNILGGPRPFLRHQETQFCLKQVRRNFPTQITNGRGIRCNVKQACAITARPAMGDLFGQPVQLCSDTGQEPAEIAITHIPARQNRCRGPVRCIIAQNRAKLLQSMFGQPAIGGDLPAIDRQDRGASPSPYPDQTRNRASPPMRCCSCRHKAA